MEGRVLPTGIIDDLNSLIITVIHGGIESMFGNMCIHRWRINKNLRY
jgi:hypothetical protein